MNKKFDDPTIPAFIGLVILLAVLVWATHQVRDRSPEAHHVSSSATPTTSGSALPAPTSRPASGSSSGAAGCPSGVDLPAGVDSRVCTAVDSADVTSIQPTEDASNSDEPVAAFRSPGGSLACAATNESGTTSDIECAVASWTFGGDYPYPGGDDDVKASGDDTLVLGTGATSDFVQAPPFPPTDVRPVAVALEKPGQFSAPVLPYDKVVRLSPGEYCVMQKVGVSCWNPQAKTGLFLSSDQWISWGDKGVLGSS